MNYKILFYVFTTLIICATAFNFMYSNANSFSKIDSNEYTIQPISFIKLIFQKKSHKKHSFPIQESEKETLEIINFELQDDCIASSKELLENSVISTEKKIASKVHFKNPFIEHISFDINYPPPDFL